MSDMPKFVEFHEEGPREGFQIEPVLYPLERRAALIDSLGETGLKQIQVPAVQNDPALLRNQTGQNLFAFAFLDIDPVKVEFQDLLDDVFDGDRQLNRCLDELFILPNAHFCDLVDHRRPHVFQIKSTHVDGPPRPLS